MVYRTIYRQIWQRQDSQLIPVLVPRLYVVQQPYNIKLWVEARDAMVGGCQPRVNQFTDSPPE